MYFDKCKTIGEMQTLRLKLLSDINKEYSEARERLSAKEKKDIPVFKLNPKVKPKPQRFSAFPLSGNTVPIHEIVFAADGQVAF